MAKPQEMQQITQKTTTTQVLMDAEEAMSEGICLINDAEQGIFTDRG